MSEEWRRAAFLGLFWLFSLLAAYQRSPAVASPWPLRPSSSSHPCLAPPAAAPLPRSTRRRAPFSLPPRRTPASLRPLPPHLLPRLPRSPKSGSAEGKTGARAAAEGLAVRETGASSPAAGLLSLSFALAPCAGSPSPRARRRGRVLPRRRDNGPLLCFSLLSRSSTAASQWRTTTCASSSFLGNRRPAPPPPSPAIGGADPWQRGLRGAGRDSTSTSQPPPSQPPPQPPAPRLRLAPPRRRGRQRPGDCATGAGAPPLLQHTTHLSPFFIEPFAA
jgi:hypothetical protein